MDTSSPEPHSTPEVAARPAPALAPPVALGPGPSATWASTASARGTGSAAEAGDGAAPRASDARDAGAAGGSSGALLAAASPGAGTGGGIPPEYGPYLRRFRERVAEALVYPLAARRQGIRGTVELDVRLEATGRVSSVRVVRSSSYDLLDDAAVETIHRLGPMPFPDSLPRRALLIRIPLVFEIR
ncbi:MAG TPA: TonB family protein [Candidatus Bathyarchaeia archaeon]|nr:TonB family protein [Candidatus Bathyarchaeia archaeon]